MDKLSSKVAYKYGYVSEALQKLSKSLKANGNSKDEECSIFSTIKPISKVALLYDKITGR